MAKLRIAMLGGNFIRIPPDPAEKYVPKGASGAPETIVHLVTEELVQRGHHVTLFASGDSKTAAELVSVHDQGTIISVGQGLHYEYEPILISETYKRAAQGHFDIIHTHYETLSAHFAPLVSTPTVQTLHPPLQGYVKDVLNHYKHTQYYVSISNNQRQGLPDLQYIGTAYNGLDVSSIPFSTSKENYLVHVGRVHEDKGTLEAIQLAKKTGHRLFFFGAIDEKSDYWPKCIQPEVDGQQIVYKGMISRKELFNYVAKAKAFVFPLNWEEPFGLVLIEAMACGAPVIALRRGAVPEVVVDGKTGFIVNSLEEMIAALAKVSTINPSVCRKHVEDNFSIAKMVDSYEQAYYAILEHQAKK